MKRRCVDGTVANVDNIAQGVERSLMLVTALNKHIGYDAAAKIAKTALAKGTAVGVRKNPAHLGLLKILCDRVTEIRSLLIYN